MQPDLHVPSSPIYRATLLNPLFKPYFTGVLTPPQSAALKRRQACILRHRANFALTAMSRIKPQRPHHPSAKALILLAHPVTSALIRGLPVSL